MNSMKTLVIGLAGATPELLLEDERLVNLRRLMEAGSYGRLKSVIPPASVPSWICLASGLDPGSLGIYGTRCRIDRSYPGSARIDDRPIEGVAIWDQVAREGGKAVLVGVPPANRLPLSREFSPTKVTSSSRASDTSRTPLRDEIVDTTRKHFAEVRQLLQQVEWNYFQFVETGLDRLQRAFWSDHDPGHALHDPASPYRQVIADYYRLLDDEIGKLLELLSDETMVLVASTYGTQRCDGGFCINEWLMREGLLTLDRIPRAITPLDRLDIDWSKTRAWSEGGDCASLFFNVRGREPAGTVDPSEYGSLRADVKARLEAATDAQGRPLGTLVFEPEQIYKSVQKAAPDLIVQFGGMSRRAIDSVGHDALHLEPREIEDAGCNAAPRGAFVLAVPGVPGLGPVEGASVLDFAPTLLQLGGLERSPDLQGRSLLDRPHVSSSSDSPEMDADEQLLRDRLSGLGYLG
jgi:predicted AlkP superfamily phosphohydrolase/phosphomutase